MGLHGGTGWKLRATGWSESEGPGPQGTGRPPSRPPDRPSLADRPGGAGSREGLSARPAPHVTPGRHMTGVSRHRTHNSLTDRRPGTDANLATHKMVICPHQPPAVIPVIPPGLTSRLRHRSDPGQRSCSVRLNGDPAATTQADHCSSAFPARHAGSELRWTALRAITTVRRPAK